MHKSTLDILFQPAVHDLHHAWHRFGALLEQVEAASLDMPDSELLREFETFAGTAQTNCSDAAEMLLVCMAPVAAARPQLVLALLRQALEPLVILGIETPAGVREWLACFIASPRKYFGCSTPAGWAWLTRLAYQVDTSIEKALSLLQPAEQV